MHGILLTLNAILALSFAPPTQPPIGWEAHIHPGFDPPIEYVLVYEPGWNPYGLDTTKVKEQLAAWGPGAIPVLETLHADPSWGSYHGMIWQFLKASGSPELRERLKSELAEFISQDTFSEEDLRTFERKLSQYRDLHEEGFLEFVRAHLSAVHAPWHPSAVQLLFNHSMQEPTQEVLALLQSILRESLPEERRVLLESYVENLQARLRPFEPMEVVLSTETGEDAE